MAVRQRKRQGTAGRGPHGRLLGEDPAKGLLGTTERYPIYLTCAAAGNPVGAIRIAAAAINLDGGTSSGFAWIAVARSGVLYPLCSVVALIARNHVIGMTVRPWHRACALNKFRERLPL
jgi:hypothetical protein